MADKVQVEIVSKPDPDLPQAVDHPPEETHNESENEELKERYAKHSPKHSSS